MILQPFNSVWMRILATPEQSLELYDYFTVDVEGAQFIKRQNKRFKHWDGKTRLFRRHNGRIYRGLLPRVFKFADERGYEIEDQVSSTIPFDHSHLDAWLEAQELPFLPRIHQTEALHFLLEHSRGIVVSAVSSGKSFIAYLLARYVNCPTLIIVPNLGLIRQMQKDFQVYGLPIEDMHLIYGGQEKDTDCPITISTWHSLYKLPPTFFDRYPCVIVDEVHTAEAKSLVTIMEKCTQTTYRFGLTGTLDTKINRYTLEGLFGPIRRVSTTGELVARKEVTPVRVSRLVLAYPMPIRRQIVRLPYVDEIEFLVSHPARNELIAYIAAQTEGNTLVLVQYLEKHGHILEPLLRKIASHKRVLYLHGQTPMDLREDIRQTVNEEEGIILLATFGVLGLGVSIPGLEYLIPAHPMKGFVRTIQALGRLSRLKAGKTHATLVDIVDDLRMGVQVNYGYNHGQRRLDHYQAEGIPIEVYQTTIS